MYYPPLGPKDPAEIKVISFPFVRDLDSATIVTVQSVTVTVEKGTDANPSAMLSGSSSISGTSVLQKFQGGIAGVVYRLRAKVLDSNGNVHVCSDTLSVETL